MCVGILFVSSLLTIYGPTAPPHAMRTTFSLQSKVQDGPKVKKFAFVHHETTGITSYVIAKGKEMAIQFSADSDPLAVKSLNALNSRVFLPNTDGKKLFLIGQLFAEPKRTPSCDKCPAAEQYREFRLVDWYINTPFRVVREDCGDCSYLLEKNLKMRRTLELKDFQEFEGRDNMDLRRFQREKRMPSPRKSRPKP